MCVHTYNYLFIPSLPHLYFQQVLQELLHNLSTAYLKTYHFNYRHPPSLKIP